MEWWDIWESYSATLHLYDPFFSLHQAQHWLNLCSTGRPTPPPRLPASQKPHPPLPGQTQHNVLHLPSGNLRQSPHERAAL